MAAALLRSSSRALSPEAAAGEVAAAVLEVAETGFVLDAVVLTVDVVVAGVEVPLLPQPANDITRVTLKIHSRADKKDFFTMFLL
jgi:hypothetical protein